MDYRKELQGLKDLREQINSIKSELQLLVVKRPTGPEVEGLVEPYATGINLIVAQIEKWDKVAEENITNLEGVITEWEKADKAQSFPS
jgi:hypothetical protein